MTSSPHLTYDPATLAPDAAALLPRLADADSVVRRIALLELADLEDPDLVPVLVGTLEQDASADVRREAATVLAAWESDEVVEALCAALLDASDEVRNAAAQSLSELKDPACGPVLAKWANHAEPFVQASVLRSLRELRYAGAFDSALGALAHEQPPVRLEAVGVLGWLKDERALASLASLATTDADADVRRAAVGALGFAAPDHPATVRALLASLGDDTAWQVREEAATTLGKLRAAGTRAALVAALEDAYWQVRLRAARSLGKLGDVEAGAALAGLLSHSISNLRKEAALALGELRDPRTLAALHAARDDRDPDVRKAVRIAVQQIGSRPS
jgi:HEAT repeat protein